MTVHPTPKNLAHDIVRRLAKRQPRTSKPKNSGEMATRKLVAARSGGQCEMCGMARAESVHHRRKRSQGGPWSATNCVAVCGDGLRGCHGWIEGHPAMSAAAGFHLCPGDDPAQVAINSGIHGRVLLGADGSVRPIGGAA